MYFLENRDLRRLCVSRAGLGEIEKEGKCLKIQQYINFFWCRMITGRTDFFGIVKHENYQTDY